MACVEWARQIDPPPSPSLYCPVKANGARTFPVVSDGDIKQQILTASLAIVPAARGCVYDVSFDLEPYDHMTADGDTRWTLLYHQRFRAIDPFHPRHFADQSGSVYGTNCGGGSADEQRAYVRGFRRQMGMAHKVEVFLRNRHGRIIGGIRLSRTSEMGEFRNCEVAALRAMQPVFSSAWPTAFKHGRISGSPVFLTARENDVLYRLMEGMPDKLICRELGLALPTVKCHVRSILRKTGASRRAEVIAKYLQPRSR